MQDQQYPEEVVLQSIIIAMVDEPDAVRIERTADDMGILLSLRVAPGDIGKVIGVAGMTAKAIRTIIRCVGIRFNRRVNVKIIEPSLEQPVPAQKVPLDELDSYL